ncbi:MAG: DegT/DnrJ/EryC1/StrS family aminotransferase, partial [Chloroflexi bacterium]|nr:DegT/DnrJ/EryC1/StrS family aminotransferase [Chloroflexota bacterium]
AWYTDRLKNLDGIITPEIASTTTKMSWFVYVIRITAAPGRNRVMELLKEADIPSRPYFTPIHLQPFYRDKFGYKPGDYPETEAAGNQCLALPFSSVMTEDQVDHVSKILKTILEAV